MSGQELFNFMYEKIYINGTDRERAIRMAKRYYPTTSDEMLGKFYDIALSQYMEDMKYNKEEINEAVINKIVNKVVRKMLNECK